MKVVHQDSGGLYLVVMSHTELCSASGRGPLTAFDIGSDVDALDVTAVRARLQKAFEALRPIVGGDAQ